MQENGARPPDLEQWPDAGPVKLKHKIENTLSQGQKFTLRKLAEVVGGPTKTAYSQTSRAVYQMLDDGLLVSLENPDDRKKKVFRWSYFEAADPTPLAPAMGDFMDADPSVMFEPANPLGYRSRAAFKWLRVRGTKVWEETVGGTEKYSDDELIMLLSDIVEHQGSETRYFNSGLSHKRGGNISGHECLGWAVSRGLGGGARHVIGSWIGQTAETRKEMLWLPECVIANADGGYRLHPLVAAKLKIVSAISGMVCPEDSTWGCSRDIVRQFTSEAANVWRIRTFVGS